MMKMPPHAGNTPTNSTGQLPVYSSVLLSISSDSKISLQHTSVQQLTAIPEDRILVDKQQQQQHLGANNYTSRNNNNNNNNNANKDTQSAGTGGYSQLLLPQSPPLLIDNGENYYGEPHVLVQDPAPDGGYGWVIVFASFICNLIVDGIAYTFGLFFEHFLLHFGTSKSMVALCGALLNGCYLGVGPIVSSLANRFGCRFVTILGAVVACVALVLSTIAPNIETLMVTYGIFGGVGFGMIYLPAIVSVGYYFTTKRAFATGVAVCGSGLGAFFFAPFCQYLLSVTSWQNTLLILAALVLCCAAFGTLIRPLDIHAEAILDDYIDVVPDDDDDDELLSIDGQHHGVLDRRNGGGKGVVSDGGGKIGGKRKKITKNKTGGGAGGGGGDKIDDGIGGNGAGGGGGDLHELRKPLLQRIAEEKRRRLLAHSNSQFLLLMQNGGASASGGISGNGNTSPTLAELKARLMNTMNTEPGVHSTLYLDQLFSHGGIGGVGGGIHNGGNITPTPSIHSSIYTPSLPSSSVNQSLMTLEKHQLSPIMERKVLTDYENFENLSGDNSAETLNQLTVTTVVEVNVDGANSRPTVQDVFPELATNTENMSKDNEAKQTSLKSPKSSTSDTDNGGEEGKKEDKEKEKKNEKEDEEEEDEEEKSDTTATFEDAQQGSDIDFDRMTLKSGSMATAPGSPDTLSHTDMPIMPTSPTTPSISVSTVALAQQQQQQQHQANNRSGASSTRNSLPPRPTSGASGSYGGGGGGGTRSRRSTMRSIDGGSGSATASGTTTPPPVSSLSLNQSTSGVSSNGGSRVMLNSQGLVMLPLSSQSINHSPSNHHHHHHNQSHHQQQRHSHSHSSHHQSHLHQQQQQQPQNSPMLGQSIQLPVQVILSTATPSKDKDGGGGGGGGTATPTTIGGDNNGDNNGAISGGNIDNTAAAGGDTGSGANSRCHSAAQTIHVRPLAKKDIFYSGSTLHIPQSSLSLNNQLGYVTSALSIGQSMVSIPARDIIAKVQKQIQQHEQHEAEQLAEIIFNDDGGGSGCGGGTRLRHRRRNHQQQQSSQQQHKHSSLLDQKSSAAGDGGSGGGGMMMLLRPRNVCNKIAKFICPFKSHLDRWDRCCSGGSGNSSNDDRNVSGNEDHPLHHHHLGDDIDCVIGDDDHDDHDENEVNKRRQLLLLRQRRRRRRRRRRQRQRRLLRQNQEKQNDKLAKSIKSISTLSTATAAAAAGVSSEVVSNNGDSNVNKDDDNVTHISEQNHNTTTSIGGGDNDNGNDDHGDHHQNDGNKNGNVIENDTNANDDDEQMNQLKQKLSSIEDPDDNDFTIVAKEDDQHQTRNAIPPFINDDISSKAAEEEEEIDIDIDDDDDDDDDYDDEDDDDDDDEYDDEEDDDDDDDFDDEDDEEFLMGDAGYERYNDNNDDDFIDDELLYSDDGDVRNQQLMLMENAKHQKVKRSIGCWERIRAKLPPSMGSILREMLDLSLLHDSSAFTILAISNIFGMMGFYVPFMYITQFAVVQVQDDDTGELVTKEKAAILISIIGITNTVGRLLFGFISDRIARDGHFLGLKLTALSLNNWCVIASGLTVCAMPFCVTYLALMIDCVLFGLFISAYICLTSIILVDMLGLDKLTNAFGLLCLFRGAASMAGPPLAGLLFDLTQSYVITFVTAGLLLIFASVMAFFINIREHTVDQEPDNECDINMA